jgi:DNA-binding NarL/FixJ family response regulator
MTTSGSVSGSISVLIVDDDPLVRAGLTMIIGGQPDISIVGEAPNGRAAIELLTTMSPDVVLMDIRMPVLNGLDATERILATPNPPRIIVLTTFDADEDVVRALGAGAAGFLLKDMPPAEIIAAIRRAAAGEVTLSPSVTEQLIRKVTDLPATGRVERARGALGALTERELDVAIAVGKGLSNAEIGRELHMSVATVKTYVSRLLAHLHATNRVQVAILVHDAGLV